MRVDGASGVWKYRYLATLSTNLTSNRYFEFSQPRTRNKAQELLQMCNIKQSRYTITVISARIGSFTFTGK